ncbi:hypothetical protein AB1Y20_009829 [Prymnesium parvum]|uniref:Macrocin O-methyltransferase n=1 Tax=Prymnesium parvum TaxID=97485 RepID=A0AB34K2N1_PRYPA
MAAVQQGYCAPTAGPGDCEHGEFGSWPVRLSGIESIADCALRCLSCPRCQYVSYSAPLDDCSWYHSCDLRRLHTAVQGGWSFRSVRVRVDSDNSSAYWEARRTGRKGRGCPEASEAPQRAEEWSDALVKLEGTVLRRPARTIPTRLPRAAAPLLLLGLLSGAEERREHARCTWLRIDAAGALRHMFVVGRGAKDAGRADVLVVPVDEGKHMTGQGRGEVVAARTLSGYLKMVHFARYAAAQAEPLVGMGDDDVFIQPRMLGAYAHVLHEWLPRAEALYVGAFEYFSWRTRSMVATGWGRNLGEALFEAQVGWRNCSPTGAGWAQTPHVHCRAVEATGGGGVDACVGPIAFAKGPLELVSAAALRWVVASDAFQRDAATSAALAAGAELPRADDPSSGDLYHDVQLGVWLSRHPSLRLVALRRDDAWADDWRHVRRLDGLLLAHRVPFHMTAWLAHHTARLWARGAHLSVHSHCAGAPCLAAHCAQAQGQTACALHLSVRRADGEAVGAACNGCQCWARDAASGGKEWTRGSCRFRKDVHPSLPAQCWQPENDSPPLGEEGMPSPPLAPPSGAYTSAFESAAAQCEGEAAVPAAYGVELPDAIAACLDERRANATTSSAGVRRAGFCAETRDGEQGDCYGGSAGMWRVGRELASLDDCIAACECCPRCRFVSFSPSAAHRDCSWYSACEQLRPPPADGLDYVTVEVTRPAAVAEKAAAEWKARATCDGRRARLHQRLRLPRSSDCAGVREACAVGGQLVLHGAAARRTAYRLRRRLHDAAASVAAPSVPDAHARLAQRGSIVASDGTPSRYCPLDATLVGHGLLPPEDVRCVDGAGHDRWRRARATDAPSAARLPQLGLIWWPSRTARPASHAHPRRLLEVFGQAVAIFELLQQTDLLPAALTLLPASEAHAEWLSPFAASGLRPLEKLERSSTTLCFQRVLLCKLSPLNAEGPRALAQAPRRGKHSFRWPWRAAQFLAARVLQTDPALALRAGTRVWHVCPSTTRLTHAEQGLRVTLGRRRLANALPLAAGCTSFSSTHFPSVRCVAHAFGASGRLVDDVERMRRTDVHVAVHGDELVYGFFMHAGAAVVELRPYLFGGMETWSTAYADAFATDGEIKHFVLQLDEASTIGASTRRAEGANLTAYDTYDLPVACPRAALARVLRRVAAASAHPHSPAARGAPMATSPAEADADAEHPEVPSRRVTRPAGWTALAADPSFGQRGLQSLKARGELPTIVSDERVAWTMTLVDLVLRREIEGDLVEAGTFTGGTSIAMMLALGERAPTKIMWAADSFQGLPRRVQQDGSCDRRHSGVNTCSEQGQGTFMSTRSTFEENLWRFGVNRTRLRVVEGWFSATLPTEGIRRRGLSLIRADGDLYVSTRDALRALYPYLHPGGVIYIDDYGSFGGCGKAVDEFREERNITAALHEIWEVVGNKRVFEAVWWTKGDNESFSTR